MKPEDKLQGPPIGIIQHDIWKERRKKDLAEAIKRYMDAGLHVPEEWLCEYNYGVPGKENRAVEGRVNLDDAIEAVKKDLESRLLKNPYVTKENRLITMAHHDCAFTELRKYLTKK